MTANRIKKINGVQTPILDALKKAAKQDVRFCMPGHKGRLSKYDMTELPGLDNLYDPKECILQSQQLCAQRQGVAHAFYGVNGSTGGILAAFQYFSPGDEVLISREAHISVLHAARLSRICPVFLPAVLWEDDLGCKQDTDGILEIMRAHPMAKGIFVTYPGYRGRCVDLECIAALAHEMGMIVMVDSAHGAHLGYHPSFPKPAGQLGADIWNVSFHKTLPALGQASVLYCSSRVKSERLKECLRIFNTTSPSYLVLASIDYARAMMESEGEKRLTALLGLEQSFCEKLKRLEGYRVVLSDDPSKMILLAGERGYTGFELAERLEGSGIAVEEADERGVLLLCTVYNVKYDFARLYRALKKIPARTPKVLPFRPYILKEVEYASDECGEGGDVFCYPPGIPILLKGERISFECRNVLACLPDRGYNLIDIDQGKDRAIRLDEEDFK